MRYKQLWYTRRAGDVRGPFPAGLITRYILLGRIRETDELSVDQQEWKPVSAMPDMIPEVMRPSGDAELEQDRLQRLQQARRWEDERLAGDRRSAQLPAADNPWYKLRRGERRRAEAPELLQHRAVKTQLRKEQTPREKYWPRMAIAAAILAATGVLAVLYPQHIPRPAAQCDAAPQPRVNWSNCALEGAQLREADLSAANLRNAKLTGAALRGATLAGADIAYANLDNTDLSYTNLRGALLLGANLRNADLSNADLQDADLSYADLRAANLGGANLTNVKLDRAIWFDSSVCAAGSRGVCLPQSGL
ncbi:MAG: pentapeptide repeat-containing protein [Pseudomonadota bacterium]